MRLSVIPCSASIALALAVALPAYSQNQTSDGIYGRVAGDLGIQVDVGGAIAGGAPGVLARTTIRYLQTAGVYAAYLDDFQAQPGRASRSVSLGVELRPLFLPRTGLNLQRGPATLDLFLDSFAFRLGAVVSRQPGFELSSPGLEAGFAVALPLTRSASGPWIDGSAGLRISDRQLASTDPIEFDRAALFTLTLGWQSIVKAHIVDAADGLRR